MSDLTAKDLRGVLDIVYALNDDHSAVEMPSQVIVQLGALVGCDSAFYNRMESGAGRILDAVSEPTDADLRHLPGFRAAVGQHPAFAAYRSGRMVLGTPIALTDLADLPGLRRLELYTDYYRPNGTVDQLLCIVQSGTRQSSVLAFNRGRRGFSSRDRAIVDLANAHLSQAVVRRQRLAFLTAAVGRIGRQSEQLHQAGIRLSALTPRERQVVEHLGYGLTDREIGRNLKISTRTVHKHLETIYRKLGLSNRASLVALIHQPGEPPPKQELFTTKDLD